MIRVGIIGCGRITQVRHAPEYAANPACEIAGYFDAVPGRAEELAEKYGGKAYGSMELLPGILTHENALPLSGFQRTLNILNDPLISGGVTQWASAGFPPASLPDNAGKD